MHGCFGGEQRLAGHDGVAVNEIVTVTGAAVNETVAVTGAAEANETVTVIVTGAAEENETGATKSEYALEHAHHSSLSVH